LCFVDELLIFSAGNLKFILTIKMALSDFAGIFGLLPFIFLVRKLLHRRNHSTTTQKPSLGRERGRWIFSTTNGNRERGRGERKVGLFHYKWE
jgi:hypothetical protein